MHLKYHAFDTLYHAAALLTPNAVLVTADQIYFKKARSSGPIELLSTFNQVATK